MRGFGWPTTRLLSSTSMRTTTDAVEPFPEQAGCGMEREYAAGYAALYAEHWWFRSRERFVLNWLERALERDTGLRILDVGCGDGLLLPLLSRFGRATGLEIDPAIVSDRTLEDWPIHLGPLDQSFEPEEPLDLVVALDVLEHIEDDLSALSRAFELTAPGGQLVLTVPAFRSLWTAHDQLNRHCRRYRLLELVEKVQKVGYEVVDARYFFSWVAVPKLATRLREKLGGPSPPMSVPPGAVNEALYRLSMLDHWLAARLRVPFGSSLLVGAKRPDQLGS